MVKTTRFFLYMSEVKNNNTDSKETPRTVPTGKGNTYDQLLDVARGEETESTTEENVENTQPEVEENAVETEVKETEEVAKEEEIVSDNTEKEEATEQVDVESRVKELQEKKNSQTMR